VERGARYVAFAVVTLGLFWAANSLAGEVGVACAYADARDFAGLPEVVLYTKEPLSDAPPETRHADLGESVTYRHRYQNLRASARLGRAPIPRPADLEVRRSHGTDLNVRRRV
jgi:hypothetical protein